MEKLTVEELVGMLRATGSKALLKKMERDAKYAHQVLTVVNGLIAQAQAKEAAQQAAAPAVSSGRLTDRDAWLQLAALVDSALPELSVAERDAIKREFRVEADRA
jgi:hypothetical protein